MDNQELLHTQDTTTTVCRCDEVAYYVVQECRHRGFILGRAPEQPRASHRDSETHRLLNRYRHPDVSTSWSQQSTKVGCKCCKHVIMTGVGERRYGVTYNCKLYAQVSGRNVAIATTRTQHRTAVTAHFLLCTLCC